MTESYIHLLNEFQNDIFLEAIEKKNAGLSIPVGGGKTRLSLVIALETTPDEPILIICKKTLIKNWIDEIIKIFGTTISYYVYHSEFNKHYEEVTIPRTRIVITTPEVTKKYYIQLIIFLIII